MRVFVTGATGVIGRRLVPLLVNSGHDVTAVARSPGKRQALDRLGVQAVQVDLFAAAAVRSAVAGHDVVINLATHIPPASKAFRPGAWRENDRLRREASRILVDAAVAAGASRFIQESFAGIYPDRGDRWIDENTPVQPATYVRSMVEAEHQVERFTAEAGTGVTLRFALFYGPDSSHTLDTIAWVRKGTAPTFGRHDGFISSVSTDDAASAVAAVLTAPAGIYNVVDDQPVTRHVYFESLAAALGVKKPWLPPAWLARVFGPLGETIARSQRLSNARLKSATSWSPRCPSIVEGWRETVSGLEGISRIHANAGISQA